MTKRPATMPLYDWGMALASLWVSGGILYDAWHHFHEDVETFFQPGHALLYAGLLAAYIFTGIALVANHRRGYAWRDALPLGYGTTLAGIIVFSIGGAIDFVKHLFLGFEEAFNALVSPPHLVIGTGMFLIIIGPLAAGLARAQRPRTLLEQAPMIAGAAAMMELIHWGVQFVFMTMAERQNAPPAIGSLPHDTLMLVSLIYYKQGLGLIAVIVQSLVMTGVAVFLARRIRVARGGYTLLFVLGNLFVDGVYANTAGQFLAVLAGSIVAGAIADAFAVEPETGEKRFALWAFAIPAGYWAVTLAVLAATMGGLWWTLDITSGSILYAGFAGLAVNALAARTGDWGPPKA